MNNYGLAISKLRKEHGMTQTQLGDRLNVSCQAVSKWENNLSQPDIDTVREMLVIFGVTMETFVAIAEGTELPDPAEETAAVAAEEKQATEPAKENSMLGVCTVCGRTVYKKNLGAEYPKLVCFDCKTEQDVKENAKKYYAEAKTKIMQGTERTKFRWSFIVGSLAGAAVLGSFTAVAISQSMSNLIWLAVILGVMAFTFVTQLFWDGVIVDIFEWGWDKSINLPGVIFSLDIDGILFLIAWKIFGAILSALIWLLFVAIAISVGMFVSVFTFIPCLFGRKNDIEKTVWHEPSPTYRSHGTTYTRPPMDYVAELAKLKCTEEYNKYCK